MDRVQPSELLGQTGLAHLFLPLLVVDQIQSYTLGVVS